MVYKIVGILAFDLFALNSVLYLVSQPDDILNTFAILLASFVCIANYEILKRMFEVKEKKGKKK